MLTVKQINARIASISKAQDKNNQAIHELLCNINIHALAHNGDVSAFSRLLEAVKGVHRKAIIAWVHEYTCANIGSDGQAKLVKARFNEQKDNITLGEMLALVPWFDGVPSVAKEAAAFDVEARIKSLIDQAEKAMQENRVKNSELVDDLRSVLTRFHLNKELDAQGV